MRKSGASAISEVIWQITTEALTAGRVCLNNYCWAWFPIVTWSRHRNEVAPLHCASNSETDSTHRIASRSAAWSR